MADTQILKPQNPAPVHGEGVQPGSLHHDLEELARRIDCFGLSEKGSHRDRNEDDFLICPFLRPEGSGSREPAYLFAVADGLGGAPAGEQASSIALHALQEAARKLVEEPSAADPGEILKDAVLQGQREMEANLRRHPERTGMGTTLTAALVIWPKLHIVHVGDSRCYVAHRSTLEQITVDHTVGHQLAELGMKIPEAASRWKNTLWNVVGGGTSDLKPQLQTLELRWGDAILLATDGLTDSLPDDELLRRVRHGASAESICKTLIEEAKAARGTDDMTIVYAQFGRTSFWKRLREILRGE